MHHSIWDFVTDFGDSAVTVPLALLTLGFLLAAGQRRVALGCVLAISGCAAVIGALKVVLGACGPLIPGVISPSGHTAMSTAVYGGLALLVSSELAPARRRAVLVVAGIAVVGIGLSRLVLHDHKPAEIVVGLVIGAAAAAVFRVWLRHTGAPRLPVKWLILAGLAVVAVMHGTRWMVEPAVHRLAGDFRLILFWCR